MRQFATGAMVVAVVALVVGLYPPAAGAVGLIVVTGSALSALYLWRIYRRSERPVLFSAVIDALALLVPAARIEVLAGAGHIPHATHPDAYVEVVTDFIRKHEG